jgi:hypothetical protein
VGAEGGRIGIVEGVWVILTLVLIVTGTGTGDWGCWMYGNWIHGELALPETISKKYEVVVSAQ